MNEEAKFPAVGTEYSSDDSDMYMFNFFSTCNNSNVHKNQSAYQIWLEGYHPKQLTTPTMMIQKIEYIHNIPVKRGYVDVPEHWRCSSSRNYLDESGLIPVTLYEG